MKNTIKAAAIILSVLLLSSCDTSKWQAEWEQRKEERTGTGDASFTDAAEPDTEETAELQWETLPWFTADAVMDISCEKSRWGIRDQDFEGMALYISDEKMGVIKSTGEITIPAAENVHWCKVDGLGISMDSEYGRIEGVCMLDGTIVMSMVGGKKQYPNTDHDGPVRTLMYLMNENKVVGDQYSALYEPDWSQYKQSGTLFIGEWVEGPLTEEESIIVPVVSAESYYVFSSQEKIDWNRTDENYTLTDENTWVLIDRQGRRLTDEYYQDWKHKEWSDYWSHCTEFLTYDYFCVQKQDGTWAYIAQDGTELLSGYYDAKPFRQGVAAVQNQDGQWGYINTAGELLVPYVLEDADAVFNGVAWAKQDGKWGRLRVV